MKCFGLRYHFRENLFIILLVRLTLASVIKRMITGVAGEILADSQLSLFINIVSYTSS